MSKQQVAAAVFILVWYAIGFRWIWLYRRGNLLDFDEAGYLSIAAAAVRSHDYGVVFFNMFSPVTTGITATIFSVSGIHVVLGFLAVLTVGAVTLFVIFSVGWRIGGPYTAWAALILVATMPEFVDYSREFHFAMGSTLATMLALYCLLRSEGMVHRNWASWFGFCVGMLPLTRTMAIAYMPGFLLAALISALGYQDSPERRGHVRRATIIAAITTAFWLVPNSKSVLSYLLDFGYGGHSGAYGSASLINWESWLATLHYYCDNARLIHSALFVIGLAIGLAWTILRLRGLPSTVKAKTVAHSPLLGPVVLVAFGTIALGSTPNHGTAFDLPMLSAFALISAWGLTRMPGLLSRTALVVVSAAAAIVLIPDIDLHSRLAQLRTVDIPGLGLSVITDGRGYLQRYEALGIPGPAPNARGPWLHQILTARSREPVDLSATHEYEKIIDQTADFIRREDRGTMPVAFGFRHLLYNLESVQLTQFSKYAYPDGIPWGSMIDPMAVGTSEQDYFRWLTESHVRESCLLFTSAGVVDEAEPVVDSQALTAAAQRAKFAGIAHWSLPDRREVVVWRREVDSCRVK